MTGFRGDASSFKHITNGRLKSSSFNPVSVCDNTTSNGFSGFHFPLGRSSASFDKKAEMKAATLKNNFACAA